MSFFQRWFEGEVKNARKHRVKCGVGGEERGGASPAAQLPSVWKNLCNTQAGLVCEQVGVAVGWDGAEG